MPPPMLPPRPRILVVSLRRIGDVLLTTPLIRSLRRAWPQAAIDVLVFDGAAGILKGNPDIDRIVAMPERPAAFASIEARRATVGADTIWPFRPRPATGPRSLPSSPDAGAPG